MTSMRCAAILGLLLASCFVPVHAEEETDRPRIGLALSGGGARGGAHVGVLKALETLEVPVDYIAGTSMGAIIGGLYAAGYTADEIETVLQVTDWSKALSDRSARPNRTMRKKELESEFLIPYRLGFNKGKVQLPLGVIEGQHLDQIFHEILQSVVHINNFNKLPIPFRAIATNLVTGEEVILASGSLPDSLRASMSVPGVFAPVRIEGQLLVDGGMSNNLPVSVVRSMGADIVIAVDISSQMLTEEQLTSVLSVTEQLTNLLVRRTTEAQIESLSEQDILIVPELGDFSSTDFENADQIVHLGRAAAMALEEPLAQLAASSLGVESPDPSGVEAERVIITFIEIDNESVLNDELIHSRLDVELGKPLDLEALHQSLDRIYSLDVFKSVTYEHVENEQGERGLKVNAIPRHWGPNYLQFGLELASDFSGNNDFKLGASYTRNALNSLGGDMRILASIGREDELAFDWYQPVDKAARWFVSPRVYWRRENYGFWLEDAEIAKLEISGWGSEIGIGRNFGTTDQVRLEYEFARADSDVVIGFPSLPLNDKIKLGELMLEYQHDSLDSIWFPTEGMLHRWAYRHAVDSLGASDDYEQAEGNGTLIWTGGKNTILANYELGYSFDDAAPVERWFRMGGFARLSGLVPNQISGRHNALLTLAYYRRLNDFKLLPAFAGATLESGNVWDFKGDIGFDDLRYSGSIFVGAETPIGPVYFAYGISDSGDNTAYFYVGNPFRVSRFD